MIENQMKLAVMLKQKIEMCQNNDQKKLIELV